VGIRHTLGAGLTATNNGKSRRGSDSLDNGLIAQAKKHGYGRVRLLQGDWVVGPADPELELWNILGASLNAEGAMAD
jgi:hypothetical protein